MIYLSTFFSYPNKTPFTMRLGIIPALLFGICMLCELIVPLPSAVYSAVVIMGCMPCGVNTIVFPSLVGEDCRMGARFVLLTHILCLTRRVVKPCVDVVSFAGSAVQIARESEEFPCLCRDGFHLSYSHGRYIAALTFLGTLTDLELDGVSFAPEGVSDNERKNAIACAKKAIER